jgi:mannose-6-phosphate isomerase-like protein (cupin superfamily)
MQIRRVVTGHDSLGKAVFASDELVDGYHPMLNPESAFHMLWGADEAPHLPDDGSKPTYSNYFPAVGGFRFGTFTLPPAGTKPPADLDIATALAEMEEHLPGLLAHMDPGNPGMHTTSTVDFEVVLSGEVVLELDEGAEVTLRPGDTVVQNGTRHAWHNRGEVPAHIAVFLVGAHHANVG